MWVVSNPPIDTLCQKRPTKTHHQWTRQLANLQLQDGLLAYSYKWKHTWRISHLEGGQPYLGGLLTMVINHLLSVMILQVWE